MGGPWRTGFRTTWWGRCGRRDIRRYGRVWWLWRVLYRMVCFVLRTGYLSFLVLLLVLSCLMSSLEILLLAGDVVTPLPTSMFLMSSSALLLSALLLSQSSVLSSSLLSSTGAFHLSSSSSPNVSLQILLLLNSALELSTLSSPHLWMSTASAICLVRAVLKYLTGRRWNEGTPLPPWCIWWCLSICKPFQITFGFPKPPNFGPSEI